MMPYDLAVKTAKLIVDTRLRDILLYCGDAISGAERDAIAQAMDWTLQDINKRVLKPGVGRDGWISSPEEFDDDAPALEICFRIGNRQVWKLFNSTRDSMPATVKAAIRKMKEAVVKDIDQSVLVHGVDAEGGNK